MRYTPRRRRGDEERHEGGGLPVIPLVIIVVFAGLLLGGLLAHFFGSRGSGAQEAMSPSLVTPVPSPSAMPSLTPLPHHRTPRPTPRAHSSPTPLVSLTPRPTAKPAPTPEATPTVTPHAVPTARLTPAHLAPRSAVPAPATTLPAVVTASPAPPPRTLPPRPLTVRTQAPRTQPPQRVQQARGMETNDPVAVVRAYLYALARGNTSQATSYLASGSPDEPFMRGARVADVESTSNGDGTYLVTADVRARGGSYRVTCTVAALPQGMVITDHFYVKPQ
jgi:hypothetical protein